jgi:hypothetical protein
VDLLWKPAWRILRLGIVHWPVRAVTLADGQRMGAVCLRSFFARLGFGLCGSEQKKLENVS